MTSYNYIPGWWFEPLWKILVNWDDYSQYMGKSKPPTRFGLKQATEIDACDVRKPDLSTLKIPSTLPRTAERKTDSFNQRVGGIRKHVTARVLSLVECSISAWTNGKRPMRNRSRILQLDPLGRCREGISSPEHGMGWVEGHLLRKVPKLLKCLLLETQIYHFFGLGTAGVCGFCGETPQKHQQIIQVCLSLQWILDTTCRTCSELSRFTQSSKKKWNLEVQNIHP